MRIHRGDRHLGRFLAILPPDLDKICSSTHSEHLFAIQNIKAKNPFHNFFKK